MRRGFTLIELLVSISILAILFALSAAAFQGSKQSARDSTRRSNLEQIRSGLEIYRTDCDNYPAATYTTNWPAQINGDGSTSACATSNTYLVPPADPISVKYYYRYFSDGTTYELCAYLENGSGTEVCGGLTVCGDANCNYKVTNP